MQRHISFKNDNDIKILYDATAEKILNNYNLTIHGILKLLSYITNQKKYYISLINTHSNKYETIVKLKIQTNKEEFIVEINSNKVSIEYGSKYYVFTIDWDSKEYYIKLIKYSKKLEDRIVTQSFNDYHQYTLELCYENKCFCIDIPIDIEQTLEPEIFNYIKETSNIVDLRKIYMTYFYKKQLPYDKKLGTKISIYDKLDDKFILMDEITIQNGYISKYLLSTRKENTIFSISGTSPFDSEIKIKNYLPTQEIDLNGEIGNLIIRSRSINLDI